jgi:hypothetical protein
VADHENLPAWTVGVKASRRLTEGPPALGAKYRIVGKLLGRSVESSYEITAFDRDGGFSGTMSSLRHRPIVRSSMSTVRDAPHAVDLLRGGGAVGPAAFGVIAPAALPARSAAQRCCWPV